MWNDPWAMTLGARLILAATLAASLYVTVLTLAEHYLPVRQVVVTGVARAETRAALGDIVASLRGSLFSMDLAAARQGFEAIPWVRQAQVSRVWPSRLHVALTEQVPAAAWNGSGVLNVEGEVFPVAPWRGLPDFRAPDGMEQEVARRYAGYAALLRDSGLAIAGLHVDARHAWRLTLRDAHGAQLSLDLGRERMEERLRRFLDFYPVVAAHSGPLRRVDMRYPNGFAVDAGPRPADKT